VYHMEYIQRGNAIDDRYSQNDSKIMLCTTLVFKTKAKEAMPYALIRIKQFD
jgi:hypothetical protein